MTILCTKAKIQIWYTEWVTLPIKKGVRNYFHNITAMYTYHLCTTRRRKWEEVLFSPDTSMSWWGITSISANASSCLSYRNSRNIEIQKPFVLKMFLKKTTNDKTLSFLRKIHPNVGIYLNTNVMHTYIKYWILNSARIF